MWGDEAADCEPVMELEECGLGGKPGRLIPFTDADEDNLPEEEAAVGVEPDRGVPRSPIGVKGLPCRCVGVMAVSGGGDIVEGNTG